MAKQQSTGRSAAPADQPVIDAMPTKELFIDMLTRDIGLIPAIIDLVDNSADGARKIKADRSLAGFWVRVEIGDTKLQVSDNCGGITIETAQKYAFRFGRPPGAPSVKHSVGQFGVGMKRAIFKVGRHFHVESTTKNNRFVVDVDVNEWAHNPKWEFEFAELDDRTVHAEDYRGTKVTVTKLHPDVAELFTLGFFETELKNELEARLQDPISRGLAVTLNQIPVTAGHLKMLSGERLTPAYKELTYDGHGDKPVIVKLYCGLGRSDSRSDERTEAGWHIFCNGRLILEGDKSEVTGWGAEEDDLSIPGFHGQYNYLRGFAYFDSDDPARLPWNTTKTGINIDSPIYRSVKPEMMRLMRPVVDFLNRLKDEKQAKEDPDEKGQLEKIVDAAEPESIAKIETRPIFEPPQVKKPASKSPKMQRIQYDAPEEKVRAVKKALKVASFKEVGEKTFDYFYNAEIDE